MSTVALVWPARVVVLDGDSELVVRGRPAEYRQRGLALSGASGALDALARLARDPASAVVIPADSAGEDAESLVEAVQALTGTPVIIGVRFPADLERWRGLLSHPDVRVVELPVTPAKLGAIVDALHEPEPEADRVLRCGALELRTGEHRVQWHGSEVRLPRRPFDVLELLMAESPRVVPAREIVARVHPVHGIDWSVIGVRSAIKTIRHELRAAVPERPLPIASVRTIGYAVTTEPAESAQVIEAVSRSTRS
ncbi:MAG: response regulator transcription factor [Microbacteriaceae bacterium]|nr:response regulator transcription factor [Microbacteriaceae bacterium]